MLHANKVKESDLEQIENDIRLKSKRRVTGRIRLQVLWLVSMWRTLIFKIRSGFEKISGRCSSCIKIDVFETENRYRLLVDTPGVLEKDLNIDLSPRRIVISCNRVDSASAISRERSTGDTRKTIYFRKEIDPETCDVKIADGLLKIEIDQLYLEKTDTNKIGPQVSPLAKNSSKERSSIVDTSAEFRSRSSAETLNESRADKQNNAMV